MKEIYVSTKNQWNYSDGSKRFPFSTIGQAKNYIREHNLSVKEDVVCYLKGGHYNLIETEVFSCEDGGKNGHTITYKAWHNEKVYVESTVPLLNWKKFSGGTQYEINNKIKNNLYEADLPCINGNILKFKTLYRKGKRLPCAKSIKFSSIEPFKEFKGDISTVRTHFLYDKVGRKFIKEYDNIQDIRLHTMPSAVWNYSVLPLSKIDTVKGELTTQFPCLYALTLPYYWGKTKRRSHLENSIYFIRKDGDWAIDTLRKKVYIYSLDGFPNNIEAPRLTELIKVEGKEDKNGSFYDTVKNITFEGITFTKSDMFIFPHNYIGYELQHGWDLYDTPDAMVRLRGTENIKILNCHFCDGGSSAFRCDLHGKHNVFYGNLIERMGMGGVLFAGYGPGELDLSRENVIENNYIRRIGEIYQGSNGIFLWQSGHNKVSNNKLIHLPYSGIVISGRIDFCDGDCECKNTIRRKEIKGDISTFTKQKKYLFGGYNIVIKNEISHVVEKIGDGNGIYISGTDDGNYIGNNIIKDTYRVGFMGGIRMDDNQYGTTVCGNIIYNVGIGCGIENKQVNRIINNYIIDLKLDNRFWFSYLSSEVAPVKGTEFHGNIVYAKKTGKLFFDKALYGKEFNPYEMNLSDNIYYCEECDNWAEEHLIRYKAHNNEIGSIETNPGFYDAVNGDFRLKQNSVGIKKGIPQIPYGEIGLKEDFKFFVKGKAVKYFLFTDRHISYLSIKKGEKVRLIVKGRNKHGVPVKVNENQVQIYSDRENIVIIDNGYAIGKETGNAILYSETSSGEILFKTEVNVKT